MQIKSWQIALIGIIFSLVGGLGLIYENFFIKYCDDLIINNIMPSCRNHIESYGENPIIALLQYLFPAIISFLIIFLLANHKTKRIGAIISIISGIIFWIYFTIFNNLISYYSNFFTVSIFLLILAGIYYFKKESKR